MTIGKEAMQVARNIADREARFADVFRAEVRRIGATSRKASDPAPGAASPNTPASTEREALVAEFDRSPALQHEFMTIENFVAFKTAEAQGRFKILRRV